MHYACQSLAFNDDSDSATDCRRNSATVEQWERARVASNAEYGKACGSDGECSTGDCEQDKSECAH